MVDIKKTDAYSEITDERIEALIDDYVTRLYKSGGQEVVRIRRNIWTIREELYSFNIIITSMLVIFDATLFETLPEKRLEFFEDLLNLNAHQTKSSKLCLVKNSLHLRIIRGLEDFDYSEFVAHVQEYRELYPAIQARLLEKFFPEMD